MRINLELKPRVMALIVYLFYLLILTMSPFESAVSSVIRYELVVNLNAKHFALNILLFIPFGFLMFSLIRNNPWEDYIKIFICVALGASLSFIIETYQLFLFRASELSDIFSNTTGAFIGAVLAKFYHNRVVGIIRYNWIRIQRSKYLLILIVVLYSVIVFSLSVFPIQHVDFRNWDPSFTFQIGNEATLDRAWVGKIYLVAIYNRDLLDEEVSTNFKEGPYSRSSTRIKDGLVASYNFKENGGKTVHDISGFGSPLNLTVYTPSKVRWLTPNGLEILDSTIIRSQSPAEKLYNAIKSTNEFTVEAWIAPGNISQEGPARIVSFSEDPYLRNFTLGQQEKDMHFRVRTPASGLNGTRTNLKTIDNFLTTEIQHLVATYRGGIETLFVNGVKQSEVAIFGDIKLIKPLGDNLVSKIAFCFFYFLPLSFLSYTLFSNRFGETKKTFTFSVLLSFGLLVIIETFYVALFPARGFDFTLLSLVVLVGVLTAFFYRVCAKSCFF